MSTDAPRFNPEATSFTPTSDADLAADPTTGVGPDGTPLGAGTPADDTPGADVNATASGNAAPEDGGGSTGTSGPGGSGGQTSDGASDDGPGLGSPEKDPSDWVTGDEPMTGPQGSYLSTLAREAGEEVPENLSKAQASEMIDRLQGRTGRGS